MDDLRYPIGPFERAADYDAAARADLLARFERLPARLRAAVEDLDAAKLDTPYRDGGWTVRQVVHHVPDSQINGYVRVRQALTLEEPVIQPYPEAAWSALPDAVRGDVQLSLDLFAALNARWAALWHELGPDDWGRRFVNPEWGTFDLAEALHLYTWHGEHHLAHVTRLREREGW